MDGIIVINKPKGCTSHDVVYKVKKIFNERVGHTGTLDPNATGVLPLLIGKGTKLSKYLINHDKIYEVVLKIGIKTDTADSEGKIIEEQSIKSNLLTDKNVINVLSNFQGKQEQIPPIYSAIKVNGKKLYEYARNGEKLDLKPRQIEIYSIELLKLNKKENEISFKVECSKGTYIRSLCEDIAKKLGTIGYMKELNRIKVGKFNIEDAVTIEQLQENIHNTEFMNKNFYTFKKFFSKNKSITMTNKDLRRFLNGIKLNVELQDDLYKIYDNSNKFIGIGEVRSNRLKREIIL
ncbi:MAG: tRNA pseudouridine(55) synthase TruB [Clostridia bacterium]|nr:tRNA pseudouridine(55) synthase TruB [Clostridia bacterium]